MSFTLEGCISQRWETDRELNAAVSMDSFYWDQADISSDPNDESAGPSLPYCVATLEGQDNSKETTHKKIREATVRFTLHDDSPERSAVIRKLIERRYDPRVAFGWGTINIVSMIPGNSGRAKNENGVWESFIEYAVTFTEDVRTL